MDSIWPIIAIIALLVVAILAVLLYRRGMRTIPKQSDDAPMSDTARRILVAYLLGIGVFLVYMLVSLYAVDIPDPSLLPESLPEDPQLVIQEPAPDAAPVADASPVLIQAFSRWKTGKAPSVSVFLYGYHFDDEPQIRVNMKPPLRKAEKVAARLLKLDLRAEDLIDVGSISFEVVNSNKKISNAAALAITKPRSSLNLLGFHPAITREVQLLLLVIVAGALGSYVHSLKSLTDFIGNQTLTGSWFWWYITRPFLGMALATVFYAILRGGFLAGTPSDARVVNPFGAVALGALVGMFADKAAQKLAEIFDTMFRAGDQRSGKLTAPVINRLEPTTVPPASPPPLIRLIGDRLGKINVVRINSDERKPDTVTEREVTLRLRAEDVAKPAQFKVTAVNPDGGVSPAATFYVSTLGIKAPASLPPAKARADYAVACTASGGEPRYKWSLGAGPPWLKINTQTGALTGKPETVGTEQVTITVVDCSGTPASKEFELQVVP